MPSTDEPFEEFEDIFEGWVDSIKPTSEVMEEIDERFSNEGYRFLASLDSNYPETTGSHVDEVYRKIMQALDEDGTVAWYSINNAGEADGNATFGSLSLKRRPNGMVDEDIHIAKYYDGDYDFNEHILTDDPYVFRIDNPDPIQQVWKDSDAQPDMKYIGLWLKQHEALNEEGEVEWTTQVSLPTNETEKTYTWFTNSVYIPQPYNIRFTPFINETIRESLRKAKL